MKLLILTYDMIPYSVTWGGCQRIYYLSKQLEKAKEDVNVISCQKKYVGDFGNELLDNVVYLPFKNRFFSVFLKNSQIDTKQCNCTKKQEKISINENNHESLAKRILKNKMILALSEKVDRMLFNDPNFMMGLLSKIWIKDIKQELTVMINSKSGVCDGYDIVLVSGPPFGLFSVVKMIKATRKDCKIVLDYRDPWNLWRRGSFVSLKKEKSALNNADLVVFTNDTLRNDMVSKFDIRKTAVVQNGYSEDNWSECVFPEKTDKKEIVISYVGSIVFDDSSMRNTDCLFQALELIWNEGVNIRIQFIGIKNINAPKINLLKQKYGKKVEFRGIVSAKESTQIMANADVLLLLHTSNDNSSKYIISAKLYDYIRAQKFVLNIGCGENNHKKIINDLNIGVSVENDINQIHMALKIIWNKYINGELYFKSTQYMKYSREYQNKKYIEILQELIGGDKKDD